MRLMALSTSRWPGKQLRQLLRELETALATCVSRCWFSGLLGSCMARRASSSNRWDFSMTSRALSITASWTWRSVVVAATPRTAFVSTCQKGDTTHCSSEQELTELKPFLYHHHHQLSLNCKGRWGIIDDFASSFLHFSLFSTALWDLRTPGLSIP